MAQKEPLVVADITLPAELLYGQVLVKIHCSGICGSQLGEIDGVKGPDKHLPHLLGHEASGVVENCGPGVSHVQSGDHVVMHWRKGEGIESPTPTYQWGDKAVNAGWVSTFSEYAVVSENRLTPIPENLDFEVAALYGCALTTGFGAVINDAQLHIGESIAVIGVGGTGLSAILAAKLSSAYPIIAVDIYEHKLDKAKQFGASHIIHGEKEDVRQGVLEIINNNGKHAGVDVFIDTTGIAELQELAYELTDKTGRTILIGVPKTPGGKIRIESLPLHFNKSITGSEGGNIKPSYHIPRFIQLQQNGFFNPQDMITHRYALENINDAIAAMREGAVIRCSIKMV